MSTTFHLQGADGAARAGVLTTPHGAVPTPAFIPVATQGSVKTVTPQELRDLGATIVLGNTYHLYLRPGVELVREMGGLGAFMGWDGPLLTDSGGFQAYSLGRNVRISSQGVEFQSHIDGSRHLFTPEEVVRYQEALGADIIMPLDHCLAYTQDKAAARQAMERTHAWLERSLYPHTRKDQALFGIVQGGVFPDLREESAAFITSLDMPGYAIGGLAVGEPKETMYDLAAHTAAMLPKDKIRYLMGVGSPEDLVRCVAVGVDMFDCALPTRVARNGALFTHAGRVNIDAANFRGARGPVEDGCDCYACRHFTAGYIHHLFRSRELLGLRLATIHNLRFVVRLMERMRAAVVAGTFETFASRFLESYRPADEEARQEQRERWLASREREG
ncbi:MAG: tRNA guanosine(34) transglycosylase Tgt [Dehalococcoidia bacterium]|nr:tRNA guanosine(34) transglycosylase Tgt [Dehalococcoidia bacterium]